MSSSDLLTMSDEEFDELPLVVKGESKEVRYAGDGKVLIRFLPTIYSFTANLAGIVPGSDTLRLRASKVFCEVLRSAGIPHAYREVGDRFVLADLLLQPVSQACPNPFRPRDLSGEQLLRLDHAPPIEVVIKRFHSGTSKHRYEDMAGTPVRHDHPLYAGMKFEDDGALPHPIVRFDWRNKLVGKKGNRLQDEILPDPVADWYINIQEARRTAMSTFTALDEFLSDRDIMIYDLCLFVSENGKTVFGEISQDCGRFRHFALGSLDKDVWRAGGSHEQVLQKWDLLLTHIEGKAVLL